MRITGGMWRGREISEPERNGATRGKSGTHPMGSRERLAVMNMLGREVEGALIVDLYAGTGALAFEAMSRGAARALAVENVGLAIALIRENARRLGVSEARGDFKGGADFYKYLWTGQIEIWRAKISGKDDFWRAFGEKLAKWQKTVLGGRIIVLIDPPYETWRQSEFERLWEFLGMGDLAVVSAPKNQEISGLWGGPEREKVYAGCKIGVWRKK